jgi:hypothetical protein
MPQAYAVVYEELPLAVRDAIHLARAQNGRLWMMLRPLCRLFGASAEQLIAWLQQRAPWALALLPARERPTAWVRLDAAAHWLDRFIVRRRRAAEWPRLVAALLRGFEACEELSDDVWLCRGMDERFTLEQMKDIAERGLASGFDPADLPDEDGAAMGDLSCR